MLDVFVLNKSTKSLHSCVPLRGNLVEIAANFSQLPRFDLPKSISPDTLALHEAGIFKHSQVLGHGLTRDRRALLQAYRRQRTILAKSSNHRQAHGVAERGKERGLPR